MTATIAPVAGKEPQRIQESVAAPDRTATHALWFKDIGKTRLEEVGGKGANLGEMTRAGLPVPPGFVVPVSAYRRFIQANALQSVIEERLRNLQVDNSETLRCDATFLQDTIRRAAIPQDVRDSIIEAYRALSDTNAAAIVAVRSSGTIEDTAAASFAGMFESTLNVQGDAALFDAIKACWASAFTARLLFYRSKQQLQSEMLVAAVVQRMVNSDSSGVVFTVNPASRDREEIVIEAAFGLGEVVVLGSVTPDHYVVSRTGLTIQSATVAHKAFKLVRDAHSGRTTRIELDNGEADARVLSDDQVRAIASLALRDEQYFGAPQDAEWAIENDVVYLVQSRPITTLAAKPEAHTSGVAGKILVRGLGAGPGKASGHTRVLLSPTESAQLQAGEILVAPMTSPDWVPLMRKAAAVVTDAGGMTSHAAIVSRIAVPRIGPHTQRWCSAVIPGEWTHRCGVGGHRTRVAQ